MLNSITEIDRKGLFGRQASGLLSQEGDRVGQDLVAGIELNAIARVGQDLDHRAFELDEFFLGHFFIDAQVPEKAITTLTRGFPLSSVSSCTWTRIITSGFFARAFAHSCSIISNFSASVSIRCINIHLSLPKVQSICLAVSSESEHDRRMIAIPSFSSACCIDQCPAEWSRWNVSTSAQADGGAATSSLIPSSERS